MDWLKRNFWLVNVLTIAACSTSLAWAASHVIESKLLETPVKRASLVKPIPPAVLRQKDVDVILRRNVFCSDCPPLIDTGPTPGSDTGSTDPTRTSQPLQLVTVLVSDDTRWSLCILRETGSKQTGAFKLGSVLPSGWTVVAIQDTPRPRVEIALESKIEFIEFDLPSKNGDSAVASADSPSAPPSDDKDYDTGIKKVNDGRYTIQRDLLNKLLADTNSIARMARIVPAPNGSGFRLYAVRPGSFFDKIGLKNGDILRAVNGNEMSSPDRALEIYSKLRSASHVNVSIQRGGKDQSMDYTITG